MTDLTRRDTLSFLGSTALFAAWPKLARATMTDPILILIELQGANDGLNTYIPYADSAYYSLRPGIAVKKPEVLTVTDSMGFHFSLDGIANIYERGECAIVQNLGYPNPVLSHFRSIELWERGGDGRQQSGDGWLVEALNGFADGRDLDAKALYLDNEGGIFRGGLNGFLGPSAIGYTPAEMESRDTTIPLPATSLGLLGELMDTRQSNRAKINTIQEKISGSYRRYNFSRGSLGRQLSEVCTMISAGLTIPVYKVSIGSFDTHINQFNRHRDLLRELDDSITNTVDALKEIGVWNNSLIMTYSEFGRRAAENGSRGTDHGMAAPHLMMGGRVKGGFIGEQPNLRQLDNNNLTFNIDYRALYDHVLASHFGMTDNPFGAFRDPVFQRS